MGMRSPAPSYAPQPAWVQFLKSGALPSPSLSHPDMLAGSTFRKVAGRE